MTVQLNLAWLTWACFIHTNRRRLMLLLPLLTRTMKEDPGLPEYQNLDAREEGVLVCYCSFKGLVAVASRRVTAVAERR